MPAGDFPPAARCCCSQHRTETFGGSNDVALSYVSFSGPGSGWEVPPDVHPGMADHVRRAVDDYVATLDEIADDAPTVVELVQRGDSWHIAITAGELYFENAEPSLDAALACVGRVLGQSVGSCAEVPTDRHAEKPTIKQEAARLGIRQRDINCAEDLVRGIIARSDELCAQARKEARAELLASLPPCQITDPVALAKLTPARVRAYLKGKGWTLAGQQPYGLPPQWACGIYRVSETDRFDVLRGCAFVEGRSAASVYLDILQTEPEAPSDPRGDYAP